MSLAGVPSDNTTLVGVLNRLAADGFDGDFLIESGVMLRCPQCALRTPDIELDEIRRLEGASDPADMAAVLAVCCPRCSQRGTVVLRYGPEATEAEGVLLQELDDHREGSSAS